MATATSFNTNIPSSSVGIGDPLAQAIWNTQSAKNPQVVHATQVSFSFFSLAQVKQKGNRI